MTAAAFDPVRVGQAECDAWVAYYRRDWRRVLTSAVVLVRAGFGMSWPRTLWGAWLVLRANQAWAPHPDNDAAAARARMTRFYRLVAQQRPWVVPSRAAALEVEWWRVHRARQRWGQNVGEQDLVEALSALYAYVYDVDPTAVADAARLRMIAMRYSDEWNRAGRQLDDPLLGRERDALVDCYRALAAR